MGGGREGGSKKDIMKLSYFLILRISKNREKVLRSTQEVIVI